MATQLRFEFPGGSLAVLGDSGCYQGHPSVLPLGPPRLSHGYRYSSNSPAGHALAFGE